MKTYSGFNAETAQNLLLDSGAYFIDFDINTDTFETAKSKLLGATSGGGKFEAKPDIRDVKIDGVKGKAKGTQILNSWEVKMSANLLEYKKETFERALAAATVTSTKIGGKDYSKIEAKNHIDLTDYANNITWIGTLSGSDEPVIIQIFNALNSEGFSINPKDNDDIVAELNFEGFYDPDKLDTPPFAIYYPERITDTTPPTVTVVPADAAIGVAVGANIVFTFSEAIAPSTVNSANFIVMKASDGSLVAGALTQSEDKTTVTFDPTANLTAATAYIAIVNTNVADLYGNKLAGNTIINFTTA